MQIKREKYLKAIRRQYDVDLIKVLTGVRRAGKSVLLGQIRDEILEGGVSEDHVIEVNFEDVAFEKIRNYQKLNQYVLKKIKDDGKYYIFLDEIQHVRQYEKVLASLKAAQNVSIFVTGSNSKLLSGKLSSSLVGRCVEFRILPFTFSEMLEYYELNQMELPEDPFSDYLTYGGMPMRFAYTDRNDIVDYLRDIYNGIVNHDICTPQSKINREKFLLVAQYVLGNIGKRFSASDVAEYFEEVNDTELPRSMVYRYLDLMEKACLISRVKRYDVAGKRTLKAIEKQYAVDSGFKTIAVPAVTGGMSAQLENVVYNELCSRGYQVYIGKTYKGEIDFVVIHGRKKCFVQVAYLLTDDDVIEREFGAYDSVKDAAPKYVMTLDRYDFSRDGIMHVNVEKWLRGEFELYFS